MSLRMIVGKIKSVEASEIDKIKTVMIQKVDDNEVVRLHVRSNLLWSELVLLSATDKMIVVGIKGLFEVDYIEVIDRMWRDKLRKGVL